MAEDALKKQILKNLTEALAVFRKNGMTQKAEEAEAAIIKLGGEVPKE